MIPYLPEAVEHWPVDRLVAYGRNPKAHPDDQVARLAASLIEFGWLVPCLIDGDGVLIAGHGRVLAARSISIQMESSEWK